MGKITRGKLSEAELGYIAGIIDGEGCIGIHKHSDNRGRSRLHYLYVIVSNNNPDCVKFFQKRFGGWITARQQQKNWNVNYKWGLRSERARNLLETIEPYLLLKRAQAKLGIEFDKAKIRHKLTDREWKKRERFYLKMRKLNQRYTKPKPHHLKLQPLRLSEETH